MEKGISKGTDKGKNQDKKESKNGIIDKKLEKHTEEKIKEIGFNINSIRRAETVKELGTKALNLESEGKYADAMLYYKECLRIFEEQTNDLMKKGVFGEEIVQNKKIILGLKNKINEIKKHID
jgi:hypothetical protein